MMAENQQIATTGITCPMCWTPIALMSIEKATACSFSVFILGLECETCHNTFIASYEPIGDKMAWKSRVFV